MKIWMFLSVMIFSLPIYALWGAQPFSTGQTQDSLQSLVARKLPEIAPENVNVYLQYKCWSYEASVWLGLPPGATERDFKIMVIKGLKTLYSALKQSPVNQRLYYDPSNIYLYDAYIYDEHIHSFIFLRAGSVKFIRIQEFLSAEEKNTYKNQLTSNPRQHIVIWEKPFEEVAKEVGIDCSEITRDPRDVLNFSEDPAMREAIKIVRERVFRALESYGYTNYISVPYAKLALHNKEGAYDWVFCVEKSLSTLVNTKKTKDLFNPQAYRKEYLFLLNIIYRLINEAPELKPYLMHPVKFRDIQLGFNWDQEIRKNGNYGGRYTHLIYRTHNSLIMKRIFTRSNIFNRDDNEEIIPLEEFFQSIGI